MGGSAEIITKMLMRVKKMKNECWFFIIILYIVFSDNKCINMFLVFLRICINIGK